MYPYSKPAGNTDTCWYSTNLNKGSKLLGCSSSRGSSCELCGQFGVDEFLDGGDLDVVCRTECEDENRFGVECDATGKIAVQPRLYGAEMLVMHVFMR
jgi:hypothetical protein